MPSKNTRKYYLADTYYHVYNRGWNQSEVFPRTEDYQYLEYLFARSLAVNPVKDKYGREYVSLDGKLDVNAYCLMPNHFHLLVMQHTEVAMVQFMQSVFTAYTAYFNKKYARRGPLFESRFKAVAIHDDTQLMHISRYIHLNHWDYAAWQFSSYGDYLDVAHAREWLRPEPVLDLFDTAQEYEEFVSTYYRLQRANERAKKWQDKN